jgi:hypothetical protein
MPNNNTGGSAFPVPGLHGNSDYDGMTLRDYFAAKAMQGIFAGNFPITKKMDADQLVAKAAYLMADAMLKAREA